MQFVACTAEAELKRVGEAPSARYVAPHDFNNHLSNLLPACPKEALLFAFREFSRRAYMKIKLSITLYGNCA
jgi:hypothetical protein